MKPKTRIMAVSTMLTLTIAFGSLFFYIEEKKFEAHTYKKELEILQRAQVEHNTGFYYLLGQLVDQASHKTALATLQNSKNIETLTAGAAKAIVYTLRNNSPEEARQILKAKYALETHEIAAINTLMKN